MFSRSCADDGTLIHGGGILTQPEATLTRHSKTSRNGRSSGLTRRFFGGRRNVTVDGPIWKSTSTRPAGGRGIWCSRKKWCD